MEKMNVHFGYTGFLLSGKYEESLRRVDFLYEGLILVLLCLTQAVFSVPKIEVIIMFSGQEHYSAVSHYGPSLFHRASPGKGLCPSKFLYIQ